MTGHECDTGIFDRAICPEPCDTMHSYCTTCGERQDSCAHEVKRTGGKHSDVRLYGEADLAEAERRGAERAWQEGRESVAVDMMRPSVDGFKAATPNPYGAKHEETGHVSVWFVPQVADPAAPTLAELNAGIRLGYEPSIADRLRTLAAADLEAAKHGSRNQEAAAKAAARAYRLAADMIEEEA